MQLIPNFECFLSRLAVVFARSIESSFQVTNEDVVEPVSTAANQKSF